MFTQHRSLALLALTLSAQLALVATSSGARAATVAYNGVLSMSAATYSVAPSAGSITLSVLRTGGTHGALTVSYNTVAESALSGKQFTAQTGTLSWADGDAASKAFVVPILNTTPLTSPKYFVVRLSAGAGTIVGTPSNATINIVNTPTTPLSVAVNGVVSMSAATYSVAPSAGSITLTALRTGGTHGALTVSYQTFDESALSGKQFTAQTGTLSWADGDSASKTFVVPILNTTPLTSSKYFVVRLSAGTGTIVGTPSNTTINIVSTPTVAPAITKSIRAWVSCSTTIDESGQLEQALLSAANNAFTLIVDCPVRFHTGTAALSSIAVPDGITLAFQGAGEFLTVSNGPPALTVAHPSEVTFVDWNLTYL